MLARVIGLAQLKGGVGRSTVATNLAGELSRFHDVLLLDCDVPQATSASWAALRQDSGRGSLLRVATVYSAEELIERLDTGTSEVEFVVIDGGPNLSKVSEVILSRSHICLIPIGASPAEVWATYQLCRALEEASISKTSFPCLIWTRLKAHTRLAKEVIKDSEAILGLPVLASRLSHRVAYAEALGKGLTVAELTDVDARREIVGLVTEVKRLIRYDLRPL